MESACVKAEDLGDLAAARARAEAIELSAMLDFHDAEFDAAGELDEHFRRQAERSMIALEIGQAMGLSEAQVQNRLAMARRVRNQTPATWLGFLEGRVDAARVQLISGAIEKLVRPESIERLDARVVSYAESHTLAEVKRWLRDFVNRTEDDLAVERAEAERDGRYVQIGHGDEGMSWLNAYLPSPAAAAISKRLRREAKAFGADDKRTIAQREADLLTAWATSNEVGEAAVGADIAVTVPADVLAGANPGFATAADGSWVAPVGWVAELAATGNPFWHRMVIDPVTHDVLSHEYLGRFAPELLRKALEFRDGVCQTPGCLKPATECQIDHEEPWPQGKTTGANTSPRCPRHHNAKGHGVLTWKVKGRALGPPRSHLEQHLSALAIEYAA